MNHEPKPPELRAVDGAWRLFERGVAAAGVAQIAQAADLSKGGLQHYYPNKSDLVALVADRAVREGPRPATEPVARSWARVWAALRLEAGESSPLCTQLDQLDAAAVHPTRLTALERLLFSSGDSASPRLFARRSE